MKGNRSKNLPAFKSVDELVAFFETHDMGDYWEKLPEAEMEVGSKRESAMEIPNGLPQKLKPNPVPIQVHVGQQLR